MTTWADGTSGNRAASLLEDEFYDPSLAARGYLAETFNPQSCSNTSALTSGTQYFTKINLRAGVVYTNMYFICTGVGISPTLLKLGIYDKLGNLLRASADIKGTENASGTRKAPLSSTLTPTTTDMYFASTLWTGGTGLFVVRGFGSTFDSRKPGSSVGYMGTTIGQTDMQNSATINFAGTSMLPHWIGVD